MISVEDALTRVLALADVPAPETVPLVAAAGRVLAEDAVARRDQPPFPASAMDGYALCPGDTRAGARYDVTGTAGAGHAFADRLSPGEAVRIFTGAPVPDGADRVVIQENVAVDGGRIRLSEAVSENANIRAQGVDFRCGQRLSAPRLLSAADIALIAAMNLPAVCVARRPSVAIIATGDELVMPGEAPGPDQIVASNGFAIRALAEAAGADARLLPIARDTRESLRAVFGLARGSDLVVTIGGASVGDHDLVGEVARSLGMELAFYKVAMRPGKPLMAGRMTGSILLGLPGNPVSAIVCAHLFMLPLLRALQGLPVSGLPLRSAVLAGDVPANGPRAHFMRARLVPRPGLPGIAPCDRQDSALLTVLADASALLLRPPGDGPRAAGSTVSFVPLGPEVLDTKTEHG